MKLSYWEHKTWFSNVDYTVVGSGIVGLSCAYFLKTKYPKSKVLVLERGILPQGASTKNAGFACFGSISEIFSDLKSHSEDEVVDLVKNRWEGIQLLRQMLGDDMLDFQQYGGHEVFLEDNIDLYEASLEKLTYVNQLLEPVFKKAAFKRSKNSFSFRKIQENYITQTLEGQIDTGKMMAGLLERCTSLGVMVLNNMEVEKLEENGNGVSLRAGGIEFSSNKVFVATNGFASKLLDDPKVKPARAQVLITKPIPNLKIKGTFHLDEGYYYFRNIDDRILLGGGRNLDFLEEETTKMGETDLIQNKLEELLHEVILPSQPFEIAQRWSGIMGVGNQKKPIIKPLSSHIFCGVRLGGMGIALGSLVGKKLAELAEYYS